MPKLLVAVSEYPPLVGGVGTLAAAFVNQLQHHPSIEVHLFAPVGTQLLPHGHLHALYERHGGTLNLYRTCRSNAQRLTQLHAQHQFNAICYMDAASRMYGFPFVPDVKSLIYSHGMDVIVTSRLGEIVSHRVGLQKAALQKSSYVVANSKATCYWIQRLLPTCSPKIIHPCYDPQRRYDFEKHGQNPYAEPDSVFKFLTVSRLTKHKGHQTVLQILAHLRHKLPSFHYYIAGEGSYRSHIQSFVNQLNLTDVVTFLGHIPGKQLPAFYKYADLFMMLPTNKRRTESFGLVFLEAGLAELAVVGSRYGGIPEAVQDGYSGMIVDPFDLEATADSVLKLVKDNERREELGQRGCDRARKEFSPHTFSEKILQVLSI